MKSCLVTLILLLALLTTIKEDCSCKKTSKSFNSAIGAGYPSNKVTRASKVSHWFVEYHVSAWPHTRILTLLKGGSTKIYLYIAILNYFNLCIVTLYPFSLTLYKRVVMSMWHSTANMNNNPFYLVQFWTFHTVDAKFSWVRNSVDQFLMLISSFIKFEPLQVRDE